MDHCPVCGKVLANSTTSRTCTCGYSEWFGPHMLNQEPATMSNQEPDGWCAWHPEHGYEVLSVKGFDPPKIMSEEIEKYGWNYRPVMLISPQERSRLRLIEQGFNKIHRHMLEQANDETLWLDAESVVEHYILQELRKLHQTIEQVSDAITEDKAHE